MYWKETSPAVSRGFDVRKMIAGASYFFLDAKELEIALTLC